MENRLMVMVLVGFWLSLPAFAEKSSDGARFPEPSPEQRKAMAEAHEQMAVCLRSEKTMGDCRKQMMEAHRKACGEKCMGWPQGRKGMGHGMGMRRGAPQNPPAGEESN